MKILLLTFFSISMFSISMFSIKFNEPVLDIQALAVTEYRTKLNGIYFDYEIKNSGNVTIPAKSYKVFLKVDGKIISFDKSTYELKPEKKVKYKSQKVFYAKGDKKSLKYSLEIKYIDSNAKNNVLGGKSIF